MHGDQGLDDDGTSFIPLDSVCVGRGGASIKKGFTAPSSGTYAMVLIDNRRLTVQDPPFEPESFDFVSNVIAPTTPVAERMTSSESQASSEYFDANYEDYKCSVSRSATDPAVSIPAAPELTIPNATLHAISSAPDHC